MGSRGRRSRAEVTRSSGTNGKDGKDTHGGSGRRRPWQQGRAPFVSWQIRIQTRKGERLEKEGEGNRGEKEETGGNSSAGGAPRQRELRWIWIGARWRLPVGVVLKTKEKWWLDREGSRGWREAIGWLGWSGRIPRKEEGMDRGGGWRLGGSLEIRDLVSV